MRCVWRIVLLAVASIVGLTPITDAAEKISFSYLLGSQGAVIDVMKAQKIAERHGLDIDAKGFLDVGAMDRAFILGEYDAHLGFALNQWATFLNQGHDVVGIYGTMHPTGILVVPAAAPYKDLRDLVGKRVGVYGIHGTSTAIFGVLAYEKFGGMDIRKSMQLFNSSPPALSVLIGKKEVDAALSVPPFVPKMVKSGQYRVLHAMDDEWKKITGQPLPFCVLGVTRKTMEAKPKTLRALIAAWRESVDYLRQNPDSLNGYLATAKITTADEQKLAQQMMVPHYMNTWTAKDVEVIRAYWDKAFKAGFLEAPIRAQNWYSLEFAQ